MKLKFQKNDFVITKLNEKNFAYLLSKIDRIKKMPITVWDIEKSTKDNWYQIGTRVKEGEFGYVLKCEEIRGFNYYNVCFPSLLATFRVREENLDLATASTVT